MATSTASLRTLRLTLSHHQRRNLTHPTQRLLSTLQSNPHIYIHAHPSNSTSLQERWILSYSPIPPADESGSSSNSSGSNSIYIATSDRNPPVPDSITVNPRFSRILHATIAEYACKDDSLVASAAAFASSAGSGLGSGGVFFGQAVQGQASLSSSSSSSTTSTTTATTGTGKRRQHKGSGGGDAGGASAQGGYGSGGHTGFMHVADERCPAAYGRIPEPEDIFGSVQIDARGGFVGGKGEYQESGTYRLLTREGCLGLSSFLRERVIEALKAEEDREKVK